MASSNRTRPSTLYPPVLLSNPDSYSASGGGGKGGGPSLYPTVDASDLAAGQLFPDDGGGASSPAASAPPECVEEVVLTIPGAIVNLIDREYSVELAAGRFSIVRLRQGGTVLALFARVGDDVQWPLAKDEAAVKLDDSHYFFSLRLPPAAARGSPDSSDDDDAPSPAAGAGAGDVLNYGLTFASKGQEKLLKELDAILEASNSFSVQKVAARAGAGQALDASVARGVAPAEMRSGAKKEMMEKQSAAYWTTLAPNVEEYSGYVAKGIALGSGQLIRGIIWCGDVTVDRLKWGNEVLKKKIDPNAKKSEISRDTIKRMKRVKRVTKMSEKVANGVLSGVVKVTGFFTSSVANSKVGKKFFSLLPGEIVLASLDGFGRVCDAVEVSGKNVLSTSSTVTTNLVSHRYGEEAAELTNESFSAAGHALGTAWAVFKVRKGLNPKSVLKPSSLAKSAIKAAAADAKSKRGK